MKKRTLYSYESPKDSDGHLTFKNGEIGAFIGSRKQQQDTALVLCDEEERIQLAGVFDGLGGHANGAAASEAAAQAIVSDYDSLCGESEPHVLEASLNSRIRKSQGMTTAVCAFIDGSYARLYSVGDSLIVEITKDGLVRRLNKDPYPDSCFTTCLPCDSMEYIGLQFFERGSRLILCSDGISESDIQNLVWDHENNYARWAEGISYRDGADNVSYVVVNF